MAILDFLKNKEDAKKNKPKKPTKTLATPSVIKQTVEDGKFSYNVIKEPHISEKGTYLAEINQYTFEVDPQYSKQEIRKAVEGIYGVNVLSVNTIKIPQKKRRLGKTQGFRKKYKKAIVTIKEGQKIEIL